MYSKAYPKLAASSKELFREDELEDDEFSSEKLPPPDTQVLNCKEESGVINEAHWKRYLSLPDYEGSASKKVKEEDHISLKSNDVASQQRMRSEGSNYNTAHKQAGENTQNTMLAGSINLEKNPIMRQHQNINISNPLLFNPYQNQIAPVNINLIGHNGQFSNYLPTNQNINMGIQGYYSNYVNQVGVNVNSFSGMSGINPNLIAQSNPLNQGLSNMQNIQQKVLVDNNMNKLLGSHPTGMHLYRCNIMDIHKLK